MFAAHAFAILLLVFCTFDDSQALRGALFRTGRSIPFDRLPGTQSLNRPSRSRGSSKRQQQQQCKEVQLYVPCQFSRQRDCLIEQICVNVAAEEDGEELELRRPSLASRYQPRRNDFLRFGRSDPSSGPSDDVVTYRYIRIPVLDAAAAADQ